MSIEEYLTGKINGVEEKPGYYVEDIPGINEITDDAEFDYLFILESPHTDEVKDRHPLAGDSGNSVTKFLLKKNNKNYTDEQKKELKKPFGKIVEDSYVGKDDDKKRANSLLNNKKIAIVNVSNVPLQVINANRKDTEEIKEKLEKIRDNAVRSGTVGSICLLELFIKKLKKYILAETRNLTIVICGEFAKRYFDAICDGGVTISEETEGIRKEIKGKIDATKGQIRTLYVPHPSRGHWQFINDHQINLNQLKGMFSAK